MYKVKSGIHPFLIEEDYQSTNFIDEDGNGTIFLTKEVDDKYLSKILSIDLFTIASNKAHSLVFVSYELFFVDFQLSRFIMYGYEKDSFNELLKLEATLSDKVNIEKVCKELPKEMVNHPDHYGGANNPYEVIKIIEALDVSFHIGNVLKYILRAGKKNSELEDLKKARWYLDRYIELVSNKS